MEEENTMKVGSKTWWLKEEIHGSHGILNAIVFLVAHHRISILKGVEIIGDLLLRRGKGVPKAPWDQVVFGGGEAPPIDRELVRKATSALLDTDHPDWDAGTKRLLKAAGIKIQVGKRR